MTRSNSKDTELKKVANMLLTAEDYESMLQKLNGFRMGLTNRYNTIKEDDIDKTTKGKRIVAWKNIVELYK